MPEKTLSSLGLTPRHGGDISVRGLSLDSRSTQTGELFAALPGSQVHGAQFVDAALERGAAAILTDAEGAKIAGDLPPGTGLVITAEPRAALARAAALWYGAQPEHVVAVTGTNGKTLYCTTVH